MAGRQAGMGDIYKILFQKEKVNIKDQMGDDGMYNPS